MKEDISFILHFLPMEQYTSTTLLSHLESVSSVFYSSMRFGMLSCFLLISQ